MLVEAEVWTVARTDQGNAILIRPKNADVAVPIFIAQLETHSILIGLGRVPVQRPLTHDLILSILESMEISVGRVEINDLKEGTFYARLVLMRNNEEYVIDARPSDSIALAVRVKCPIYISETVVDEASIPIEMIGDQPQAVNPMETDEETGQQTPAGTGLEIMEDEEQESEQEPEHEALEPSSESSKLDQLKKKLEQAVENENYEEAAHLRDQINEIENGPSI